MRWAGRLGIYPHGAYIAMDGRHLFKIDMDLQAQQMDQEKEHYALQHVTKNSSML